MEFESGEEEEVDDETLARRLFLDEQLAHQQRLLALAGKPTTMDTVLEKVRVMKRYRRDFPQEKVWRSNE